MNAYLAPCFRAFALAGALLGGAVHAEELPQSNACQKALKAFEEAESAIVASSASAPDPQRQRAVTAKLQPLRQRVADACLGGLTTSPPPSQRTWAAPATPVRPAVEARRPPPVSPPVTPLPRYEAPVTVTTCNAAVCIGSDGSTMTRVGPTLVGPRGACTVQGAVVSCP